jgi:anti-sigma regulatory factor (Ser/Thr protein kinase)
MLADQLALDLPMSPAAPSLARRAIDGLGLDGATRENALLLTSELVSNALRHSGASDDALIHLTVGLCPRAIRISVADRGRGFTRGVAHAEPGVEGGFGLFLVARLANAWGIEIRDGATVWLELGR